MKTEWMPVKPCEDCDIDDKERREHRYGFDNECQCDDLHCYFQEVYYQKKLLEYLVGQSIKYPMKIGDATIQCVVLSQFVKMLKELEENNG